MNFFGAYVILKCFLELMKLCNTTTPTINNVIAMYPTYITVGNGRLRTLETEEYSPFIQSFPVKPVTL
jgi:hypothetical protein